MKALLDDIAGRPALWRAVRPIAALRAALALRRGRLRLRDLDDHVLRDIGVTRAAAEAEARRPIWDAPAHWIDR